MPEVVVVTCKNDCRGGEKTECLKEIASIVDNNDTAFMLYSNHVKKKLETLGGYNIKIQHGGINNDIPVGMWISKEELQK